MRRLSRAACVVVVLASPAAHAAHEVSLPSSGAVLRLESERTTIGQSRGERSTTERWRLRDSRHGDLVLWQVSRTWTPASVAVGPVTGHLFALQDRVLVVLTWQEGADAFGLNACSDIHVLEWSQETLQYSGPTESFRKHVGAHDVHRFTDVLASDESVVLWLSGGRAIQAFRLVLTDRSWSGGPVELPVVSPIQQVQMHLDVPEAARPSYRERPGARAGE